MIDNLPRVCLTRLHSTSETIAIKRGESGFYPMGDYDPDRFNKANGVTPAEVMAMEIGSMFGWDVPGADPAAHAELTEYPYTKRI